MATYTCTTFLNGPKYLHAGDYSVDGKVMFGAASSVADVVFLAKVAHGTKIVDFTEYHTTGATAQALSFGFNKGVVAGGAGNASILIASGTQHIRNSILMTRAGFPLTISLSDLDPVRYATLIGVVEAGSATTSLVVNFRLTTRADGPDQV